MSDKEIKSIEQDSSKSNSPLNATNSRRGFFKKAALGSALITSVSSSPVWGSTIGSISGNLSGNTSEHCQLTTTFDGFSPGYYKNKTYNKNSGNQFTNNTHNQNRIPVTGWTISALSVSSTAIINTPVSETILYNTKFSDFISASVYPVSDNTVQHVLAVNSSTNEKFERAFLTAILNAYHMADYPYEIIDLLIFADQVRMGDVDITTATTILKYLIHNGETLPAPTCNDY